MRKQTGAPRGLIGAQKSSGASLHRVHQGHRVHRCTARRGNFVINADGRRYSTVPIIPPDGTLDTAFQKKNQCDNYREMHPSIPLSRKNCLCRLVFKFLEKFVYGLSTGHQLRRYSNTRSLLYHSGYAHVNSPPTMANLITDTFSEAFSFRIL